MAKITKRLCIPVGSYTKEDKTITEFRDIGVVLEFQGGDGSTWEEVRLNLDILNPSLLLLARAQCEKNSSSARVKLFNIQKREKSAPAGSSTPDEEEDIPY